MQGFITDQLMAKTSRFLPSMFFDPTVAYVQYKFNDASKQDFKAAVAHT